MNRNKFLMALAAVMLSVMFVLPQITGVNFSAKADDESVSQEEESSTETSEDEETEQEEEEEALPSFAVVDGILYAAPGVTLSDILENLEGAVSIDTGKEEAAEEEPTASDEEEEEAPAEEETSEPAGEDEAEEPSDGENNDETEEPEEEADELAGTGMTVIMEDGNMLTIVIKGDIDGDGKVTAADARMALRFAVNLEEPTEAQENAALVKEFIEPNNDNDDAVAEETEPSEEDAKPSEEDSEETEPSEEPTEEPSEEETEPSDEPEAPVSAVTAADARAILRAAVSLENAHDWFAAVTGETEEEETGEEETSDLLADDTQE